MSWTYAAIMLAAIATGVAQDQKLPGENYVNHVGIAYDNFDEAFAFYDATLDGRPARDSLRGNAGGVGGQDLRLGRCGHGRSAQPRRSV